MRNIDLPESPLQTQLAAMTLGLLVCCIAAISGAAGYWIGSGNAPVVERVEHRPMVRQADGSVIAERVPDARPKPPPHRLPAGSVEERRISATITPDRAGDVGIDLSLVRDGEGGRRAVVSSPDGEVVTALDVPILPGLVVPRRPWAAGLSFDPFGERAGVWVERDYGRLRIGADLNHAQDSAELRLRAGVTF